MTQHDETRESLSRRTFIRSSVIVGAATVACANDSSTPDAHVDKDPDAAAAPKEKEPAKSQPPRAAADGETIARGQDLPRPVATKESIKAHALIADYWNPIWHDAAYASKTRWGALTAAPMFLDPIVNIVPPLDVPAEMGFRDHNFLGEDWELFEPVYVGDEFTVYLRKPQRKDITPEGEDIAVTASVGHDKDVYNQNNKLIAKYKLYSDSRIFPRAPDPDQIKKLDDFSYTRDDLSYIQDIIKQEEIRGAEPRHWEDVEVGDETKPVALGPTTVWDMVAFCAGRQEMPFQPMRVIREASSEGGLLADPVTGVTHMRIEWHLANRMANICGEVHAFQFGAFARQQMARLVTNWMGDDGFIKKLHWRHLKRTPIGDTFVGRGKVIGKRVEKDEYLVDLDVWLENLCRGNISEAARVTVSLPSKDKPDTGTTAMTQTSELALGDRVKLKDRTDCLPSGYPLANAEGTMIRLYPWVEVFEDFKQYVAVRLDENPGIGTDLMFRAESLQKV